jgi:S-(hydroxymethyl)glutathione dehydrogenase/alcohol dehydrogenase
LPPAHFRLGGNPVWAGLGTATFAEQTVLPAEAVVQISPDIPLDLAALIGCGVTTGVGAAIFTAKVRPGANVLVVGCGGVGVNVIQGARIAGAAEIVAMDELQSKLDRGRRFGASHVITPSGLPEAIETLTDGEGFDYTFEAVGRATTIRTAWDATRRGGTCVVIGAGRSDDLVTFNAFELFFAEKTLVGSVYGSADIRTDFDRMLRLWQQGRLNLEDLITRRIQLSEINEALVAIERGEVLRSLVEFN